MSKCYAHRGYCSKAPENTIAAIKMALEEPGVNGVEIDVQLSRDSVPVVIHDFEVDRTTNGSGFVKNLSYKELRQLDAGSWFAPEYQGEKIPSLQEVLELFQMVNGRDLIIEIKFDGGDYSSIGKEILRQLKKYPLNSRVFLKSFNHRLIKELKEMTSNIETGLLISGYPILLMEQIKYTGVSFVSINHYYLDQEILAMLNKNNIKTMAWTVNTLESIKKIEELDWNKQVDIITNYPQRVLDRLNFNN